MKIHVLRAAFVALALVLAGCGGGETEAVAAAPAAADVPAPDRPATDAIALAELHAPATLQAGPDAAPLGVGDLDAYAKGMARETELYRELTAKVKAARAANDDVAEAAAMLALTGPNVPAQAAAAAGLDVARYGVVKGRIDEVLATIEMGAAMKPQLDAAKAVDTQAYSAEQKQQHAENVAQLEAAYGDPHGKLPADVLEAFEAREAELAKARAEALTTQMSVLQQQ